MGQTQYDWAGRRYLVTGGAGFLGSHLCEALLGRGCSVIAVDNFITGRPANIRSLLGNNRFDLIEQDITQPVALDGALAGIFHFASPASPVDYLNHPIETLRTGAQGSDAVLSLALEKACPILVASTSEVYGDPLEHPQAETYWGNVNPIGPRSCYDESKRYMEAITMAYHRVHGLETRIVRIFNTYGPRMRVNDGRVIPNLFTQLIAGKPLTVYGDGTQTRSFCYVDDLIGGVLAAFESADSGPVNLGNPVETTILELVKHIETVTGVDVELSFLPLPVDDPRVRQPDITRAQRLFGWSPGVGLNQGLQKTYQYFSDSGRGN